jgi:beta-phosphoglucomutase
MSEAPTLFPKAVIWDLDGTLIDSSDAHWIAWRETFADEGREITHEAFVADFGKRNDVIIRGHFGELPSGESERIALAKEERYRSLVRAGRVVVLPGASEWLERLSARGWRQALATSAPRGNIDAIFAVLDIGRFLDVVVSSEEVARGKPDPDVFLAAAERLSVPPARSVVVEDAPAGVEAGRRAGMRTVGVLTTHEALEADVVVSALDELTDDAFDRLVADVD